MKKAASMILLIAMIISVFPFDVNADGCTHENTTWIQISDGCAIVCDDCGEMLTAEESHNWDSYIILQEADCTEPCVVQKVCSKCQTIGSIVEAEPALGHNFVNGICSRCGEEEQSKECSHEHSEWMQISDGCALVCSECGEMLSEEQEHIWELEETEKVGCTTWGYEHNICIHCGAVEGGMPTSPLGHDYVNGICTRCGEPEVFYTVTSMDKESYDFGDKPTFTFTIRDIDDGTAKLPAWITEGDNFYWMVDFEGPNGESASLLWQMDDYELLTANDTWTFTVTIPGLVFVQYACPGEYKMYLAFWNDLGDSGWVPVTTIDYTADITPVEEKLDIDFRLNNDKIGFGFDESLFAWFDARVKSGIHINIPVYYALYYGNEFVLDAQKDSYNGWSLNIVFTEGEDKPGKYTLYATIGDKTYSQDFILGEMPEEPEQPETEPEIVKFEGTAGENATWKYDPETVTLTFSGTGRLNTNMQRVLAEMFDTENIFGLIPGLDENGYWGMFDNKLKVVFEEGITGFADGLGYIDGELAFFLAVSYQFPTTLEDLPTAAFMSGGHVNEIRFKEGIKAIPEVAFYNCSVDDLYVPKSVTSFPIDAFFCAYMNGEYVSNPVIHYAGTEEEWNKIDFSCADADADMLAQSEEEFSHYTIITTERGDVNSDGKLNSADAIYLLRSVMRPDKYDVSQNADINGDGKVNSADAIYLLRHIMRPDKYPLFD